MSRLVITFDAINNEKIFVIKNFLSCTFNYNNDTIELLTSTGKKQLSILKDRFTNIENEIEFEVVGSNHFLKMHASNLFYEDKYLTTDKYQRMTIRMSRATYNAFRNEFQQFYMNILNKKYQNSNDIIVNLSDPYSILLHNQQLYLLENKHLVNKTVLSSKIFKSSLQIETFNVNLETINKRDNIMTFLVKDKLYFFYRDKINASYSVSSENSMSYSFKTIEFIDLTYFYFQEIMDFKFIISQYRNNYDKSCKNSI